MNLQERNELIKQFIERKCLPVLENKGADYSGLLDGNKNFKETAELLKLSKYQVWAVYFKKQVDGLLNAIKSHPNAPQTNGEPLQERIIDIINYAGILESLISEEKQTEPECFYNGA